MPTFQENKIKSEFFKLVESLLATALYDFCNAFPTMLHEWMFLTLSYLGLAKPLFNVVWWLYQSIMAYSSGTGDGTFLFQVLGGVKTGCPLSSILFLLGINPIVELFVFLSDGPKLSVTRVCADDFGSAMRNLRTIKIQASIFRLAQRTTGMHLKPEKCVLIVSCGALSDQLVGWVRQWLHENVPEFKHFRIESSGKYLGWVLGLQSQELSFKEPLSKFADRVVEVVVGQAPCTVSLCRYNERAASVFSYVAQFSFAPKGVSIAAREQHALHKVLRTPPNCFSRDLLKHLGEFSVVSPICLEDFIFACSLRFAISEREYLLSLRDEVLGFLGDSASVGEFAEGRVPVGGLDSVPILQHLCDAATCTGPFSRFSSVEIPPKKVQASIMKALAPTHNKHDIGILLARKAIITLGDELGSQIRLSVNWYSQLSSVLDCVRVFVRMCWLKTIGGAWCTTCRLNEEIKWPCIFGCPDARDDLLHYLICPILWQFPIPIVGVVESLYISQRLCFREPNVQKLKALAIAHSVYHSCKNDPVCKSLLNQFVQQGGADFSLFSEVQLRAQGFASACKHFV